jgi:hypothetical protein
MNLVFIRGITFSRMLLLLLFAALSVFAQDSTNKVINNNFSIEKKDISLVNNELSRDNIKSLLELKSQRRWIPSTLNGTANITSTLNLKQKDPDFIDSDLFLFVVGSAVAFGATAAYLKFEADDNYDKYKLTNNKKYKDRTDRYDLYSGIALGVMEINFGFLIYKFLTD